MIAPMSTRAVRPFHKLNHDGDGFVLIGVEHQIGQQEVVPDPHGLKNTHRDIGGLHDGNHHREEGAQRRATIDEGGLLNLNRDGLHKAAEHKHGKSRAKAQVDDDNAPRGIEPQAVGHQREREHDHLERHNHRDGAKQIHSLGEAIGNARDEPCAHGAAQQDYKDRPHGDENGPAHGVQETVAVDSREVVLKATNRVGIRQLKGARG